MYRKNTVILPDLGLLSLLVCEETLLCASWSSKLSADPDFRKDGVLLGVLPELVKLI